MGLSVTGFLNFLDASTGSLHSPAQYDTRGDSLYNPAQRDRFWNIFTFFFLVILNEVKNL